MPSLREFVVLSLILTLSTAAVGQTYNATLLGRVTDPAGAVVPGARVTLLSQTTGYSRTATTDESGNYVIANVPIGTYQVTATREGFRTKSVSDLQLHVAQEARLDLQLEMGVATEVVMVSGAAPLVQTDSATVGTVVSAKEIAAMPLNGRDYTQLAGLAPGVVHAGNNGHANLVYVNGARTQKTEFFIDGSPNTETWNGGALVSPSVDGIDEFRVQTNLSSAEFGHGSGFINATTKSGTNSFHGTAFIFNRHSGLDARNYFAQTRPYLKRNQYGGSVGGPILRNRLFFYADYEGIDQKEEVVSNVRIPTAAFRQGDFSSLLPNTIIHDPLTGLPFEGNIIPTDRISPIAQYFQAFIPATPNSGADRIILNVPQPLDSHAATARIDYQLPLTRISGRYMFGNNERSNFYGTQIYGANNDLGNVVGQVRTHNLSLDIVHTITPNLLLNFRAGYYYNHNNRFAPADLAEPFHTIKAGIGGFGEIAPYLGHGGFPAIDITSYGGIPGGTFLDLKPKQEIQTYLASLTWSRGTHFIKTGVQLRREKGVSRNYGFGKGTFSFTGAFSGDAYADFLLGYVQSTYRSFPQEWWGSKRNQWSAYIQDDWKIHPRLTVNLGMRFEFIPWPEPLRSGSNFDPSFNKIVIASRNGQIDFFQPVGKFAYDWKPEWFITSEEAGTPFSLVETTGGTFNPRIGFAWRLFSGNDTVLRGGAGIITMPLQGEIGRGSAMVNPPWMMFENQWVTSPRDWATLWPPITAQSGFLPPTVTAVDKVFHNPVSTEWNLFLDQRLPWNSALAVGYVGRKFDHLNRYENLNQPRYGPNAWNEIPYPQFGAFAQHVTANGSSKYNALQVSWNKQTSGGLTATLAYTWSKTTDQNSTDLSFVSDRFNPDLDNGLSSLDIAHRLVASFVYDLPFGSKGRIARVDNWARHIVGGWRIAGIATFQSGAPFSVMSPVDTSGFFVVTGQRADRVAGCSGKLDNPTPDRWFDTSCFTQAAQYTIGNSGRNILRADGTNLWDLSLIKDTHFGENQYVQLRVEAFNAFNHTMFNAPVSTIGLATSGKVFSARPPRILQLGAKFYF
ncbi:MAG: carboxypeptidase regulatory-like domain-containing protein [Terriglobales bacterium]